jgi:hypothetical protein
VQHERHEPDDDRADERRPEPVDGEAQPEGPASRPTTTNSSTFTTKVIRPNVSTEKAQPSSLTTGFTTALKTPKISADGRRA